MKPAVPRCNHHLVAREVQSGRQMKRIKAAKSVLYCQLGGAFYKLLVDVDHMQLPPLAPNHL